jgi:hypothetical protein
MARERLAIILVIIAIIILPLCAYFFEFGQKKGIAIDGNFEDWSDITGIQDSMDDQKIDDINIIECKYTKDKQAFYIMVNVEGELFTGEPLDDTNSPVENTQKESLMGGHRLNIFLDSDSRVTTGYNVGELGADYMIEVKGVEGKMDPAIISEYNHQVTSESNDDLEETVHGMNWQSWERIGAIDAKNRLNRVELRIINKYLSKTSNNSKEVFIELSDSLGNRDTSDIIGGIKHSSLVIDEVIVAPEIITKDSEHMPLLALNLSSFRGPSKLQALAFDVTGSVEPSEIDSLSLFRDKDGDNILDTNIDKLIGDGYAQGGGTNFVFTLKNDLNIIPGKTQRVFLSATLSELAVKYHSIGAKVQRAGIISSSIVTVNHAMPPGCNAAFSYIEDLPKIVYIDGAFSDWDGVHPHWNYNNLEPTQTNTDLQEFRITTTSNNVNLYFQVKGTMMGGTIAPIRPWVTSVSGPASKPVPIQTDLDNDGVLDDLDPNPDSALDTDSDGWSDDYELVITHTSPKQADSDGDGASDPNDFAPLNSKVTEPPNYVPPAMVVGKDTAYIFLDSDGNHATGYRLDSYPIGADYLIHISGRMGYIFNRTLLKFRGSHEKDWVWSIVENVEVGNDAQRLETQVTFETLGIDVILQKSLKVYFYIQNWDGDAIDYSAAEIFELNPTLVLEKGSNVKDLMPLNRNTRSYKTLDVQDGSLSDWDDVTTTFIDALGETSTRGCELSLVSFAVDDSWLYIRWDVEADGFTNPAVLYDIGINRSGTGETYDVFCAAEITPGKSGNPDNLTNVSVREYTHKDVYIWNWTDDSVADDGELLLGQPNSSRNSVEARFPLSVVALKTDIIFGRFRSHPSSSVNSVVKDYCPDEFRFFKYNMTTGAWGIVSSASEPIPAFFALNKSSNVTSGFRGAALQWVIQFNNIGENISNTVWINDTIPFNMTFVDDNSSQCSIEYSGDDKNVTRTIIGWTDKGYNISYKFTNMTVGNHSFAINCTVNDTAILDKYLTNNVTLDWSENSGPIHRDNATIYVPPMDFKKSANVTQISPDDWVQWTINFDNYFGGPLNTVWINETLPFDMTYQSDNSSQCSIDYSGDDKNVTRTIIGWGANGYEISYKFTNVTVGSHIFVINCTINSTINSTSLTNLANLECYNLGEPLFASASVSVIPEFSHIMIPMLLLIIINIISRRKKSKKN